MEDDYQDENTNKYDENYSNINNISASDLDEETNKKLRGDVIGDTSYSQSFVLRTLLQFSDMKWGEEIEEDLCFLWDMTLEKDVGKYLLDLSFPSLACSAIMKCTENRFIEIVIGILANILCANCDKKMTEEEITIILQELNTDDPLILIQLARFISTIAHNFNELPFISQEVMNKVEFILYNSTNNELLQKTLEAVAKLTSNFKLDKNLVNIGIITASLAAYELLMTNNGSDEFELDTRDKQLICRYMLEIVSNVCAYIDHSADETNLLELKKYTNVFINEITKILNYFSHEENLLPITDEFVFYISVFKFVFEIIGIDYISELFFPLTKILYILIDIKDDIGEAFDLILELECFLFFRNNTKCMYSDINCLPRKNIKKILKVIIENKHKFEFSLDIQYLMNKYK